MENNNNNRCSRCNHNEKEEPHTCPFQEDVNNDSETLCDCCESCQNECAQEI